MDSRQRRRLSRRKERLALILLGTKDWKFHTLHISEDGTAYRVLGIDPDRGIITVWRTQAHDVEWTVPVSVECVDTPFGESMVDMLLRDGDEPEVRNGKIP